METNGSTDGHAGRDRPAADISPGDVFVHDGVEAVVQVAARELQAQQGLEEVGPAQLRCEADVPGLAVEGDDRLHVRHQLRSLLPRYAQLV